MAPRSLLSLPVEVLASITVHLHPHQLHALRRLARNSGERLLLPPSFAFAYKNLQILHRHHCNENNKYSETLQYQSICWTLLGENYIAALFAIYGVSYHSLSLLGIEYEESTRLDLKESTCAAMVPQAMILAAQHDKQYLPRIKKSMDWGTCDALSIQIAAISGWTPVVMAIFDAFAGASSFHVDLALDLAAQNGHLELVEYLLAQQRIPVNLGYENSSSFRHACMNGHKHVVQALVQFNETLPRARRLDPVACDSFALMKASQFGFHEVVSYLLHSFSDVVDPMAFNGMALQLAIANGQADVVRVLVADWRVDWTVLKEEYQAVLRPFLEYLKVNDVGEEHGGCDGAAPVSVS
ncbi:hypothetical protein BDR26DRAFT_1004227 [Obelidium mucronatum]|nr:hypothetical protein BDR26DRAFT_1004227 [Obelidium mucronatum]